jgi:3D (Asp-Asp-Asp) domain-containing protein
MAHVVTAALAVCFQLASETPSGGKSAQGESAEPSPPIAQRNQDDVAARKVIWAGTARVTMYTCVELGGCNRTAMGIWPYEGVVAVDPRLIPLGSQVWVEGLGTFLAADTGSSISGSKIDVFVNDYQRARRWGAQQRSAIAYAR